VRTEYRRTAFQLATSNAVRISLDTSLTFTDETRAGHGRALQIDPMKPTLKAPGTKRLKL
jgi:SPX domain protein involved in polyphosphate accumulation